MKFVETKRTTELVIEGDLVCEKCGAVQKGAATSRVDLEIVKLLGADPKTFAASEDQAFREACKQERCRAC